jgi:hypothetical protein
MIWRWISGRVDVCVAYAIMFRISVVRPPQVSLFFFTRCILSVRRSLRRMFDPEKNYWLSSHFSMRGLYPFFSDKLSSELRETNTHPNNTLRSHCPRAISQASPPQFFSSSIQTRTWTIKALVLHVFSLGLGLGHPHPPSRSMAQQQRAP